MFNFEKLDVWQKSIAFADLTYRLTRNFPSEERFGLTNQMRRAGASVSANIAKARHVRDRKSTRLNSSHQIISYAVFCLKKKKKNEEHIPIYYSHYTSIW